jgi:uncharacterized protein YjbI with pentapeptide repeats
MTLNRKRMKKRSSTSSPVFGRIRAGWSWATERITRLAVIVGSLTALTGVPLALYNNYKTSIDTERKQIESAKHVLAGHQPGDVAEALSFLVARKIPVTVSQLQGASLRGAQLSHADLRGSNLREADLRDAILEGANLSGADLGKARLVAADLKKADLRGARLLDTELFRARLDDARFHLADLTNADLAGASLIRAQLDGATLTRTVLHGADLTGASFGQAILNHADFRRADLSDANLEQLIVDSLTTFKNACVNEGTRIASNIKELQKGAKRWCGPPTSPTLGTPSSSKLKPAKRIFYLLPMRVDEFQTESQKMIEAVFDELGYEVTSMDADDSWERQLRQLKEAAALKPEAIILNAVDFSIPDLPEVIATIRKQGIRVLLYDRPVRGAQVDYTSAPDGFDIGKAAAQKALLLLKERNITSGTILQILGDPRDNFSLDVQLGFQSEINTDPQARNLQVLARSAIDWQAENAGKIAQEILTPGSSIPLIFCHGSHLTPPIIAQLAKIGKKAGEVILLCGNGSPVALRNIQSGWQQAEIEQSLYATVYGLAIGLRMANGRQLPTRVPTECHIENAAVVIKGRLSHGAAGLFLAVRGSTITDKNLDSKESSQWWGNMERPAMPAADIENMRC